MISRTRRRPPGNSHGDVLRTELLQQVESELQQVRKNPDYDAIAANVWFGAEDLLESKLNTLIETEAPRAAEGSGCCRRKGTQQFARGDTETGCSIQSYVSD